MVSQVFTLFPKLPLEIRRMVWEAAIQPRLIRFQMTTICSPHTPTKIPRQYSSAPIPPLLHTCVESREAMQAAGYELAFGTDYQAPQTWFNFAQDVLYVSRLWYDMEEETNIFTLDSDRFVILGTDMIRIRKLAVQEALLANAFARDIISGIVKICGNLQTLLLAEAGSEYGWPIRDAMLATEDRGNLIGYMEIDTADLLAPIWDEPGVPVSSDFLHDIWKYTRDSKTNGRSFFLDLTGKFEQQLREARDEELEKGKPGWAVPDIKIIRLVTQNHVQSIMRIRRQYWEFIAIMEQNEDEAGPAPLSPFSAYHSDDLEVMEEVEEMYLQHSRNGYRID